MIDGDLCEQFNSLDPSRQKSISEDLDKNPSEVSIALNIHFLFLFLQTSFNSFYAVNLAF